MSSSTTEELDEEIVQEDEEAYSVDFEETSGSFVAPVKPSLNGGVVVSSPGKVSPQEMDSVYSSDLDHVAMPSTPKLVEDEYSIDFERESTHSKDSNVDNSNSNVHLLNTIPPPTTIPTTLKLTTHQNNNNPKYNSVASHATSPKRSPEKELRRQAFARATELREIEVDEKARKEHELVLKLQEENHLLLKQKEEIAKQLEFSSVRKEEELAKRRNRYSDKRKRAEERRDKYEQELFHSKSLMTELQFKLKEMESVVNKQVQELDQSHERIKELETIHYEMDRRNYGLIEKLQKALDDLQEMSNKVDTAINDKRLVEKTLEDNKIQHQIEIQVIQNTSQVNLLLVQGMLENEKKLREEERHKLPQEHQRILECEKQRYDNLELKLLEETTRMKTSLAEKKLALEKELLEAIQAHKTAENKAEQRLMEEMVLIRREREELDQQRSQLLKASSLNSARLDEERSKMEMMKRNLEKENLVVMEEKAALTSKQSIFKENYQRYCEEIKKFEIQKKQILELGQSTLENSEQLTAKTQECDRLAERLEKLEKEYNSYKAIYLEDKRIEEGKKNALVSATGPTTSSTSNGSDMSSSMLQMEQVKLRHDIVVLSKQKMETRQVLQSAKKLEVLLTRQLALSGTLTHYPKLFNH